MFAAAENYSLGVYELGECFEIEIVPIDEDLHLSAPRREMPVQRAA
jgi:hypothetical protein